MSNSFSTSPTLVDPSRTTATQTIRTTEIARLADLQNYIFANCGTHNVISQTYDDSCFVQDSTSFVTMSRWTIPRISRSHNQLNVRISSFCSLSGAQIKLTLSYPISTNTYSDTITVTDTSRYSSGFNVATITTLSSETEEFARLTLEAKAPTGGEVEILGIQANWSPISSPLSAGLHYQNIYEFVPVGANRQGADLPLSSRFGVDALSNIETVRRRGKSLICWSGVENASSSQSLQFAANPPRGLGVGDQGVLGSIVALPAGLNEIDGLSINLFAYVVGLGAGESITVEIFNHRMTFLFNGWNSYPLEIFGSEFNLSDEFGFSVYRMQVEDNDQNSSSLLSINNQVASTAYISSLSIIGV